MQEAIPEQILAAVREHEVRTLGRPEVEITDFADGQPLKFTAEVDVRPEITLPDLAAITVTVDEVEVGDEDVDQQVDGLRQRFATLKTVERPGAARRLRPDRPGRDRRRRGGAGRHRDQPVPRGRQQPAAAGPGRGDRGHGGRRRDHASPPQLVAGDFAGRDAEVAVTVRTVKERELPALDDEFAQLASEFDTLDELRADLTERLARVKRVEQLYAARDKALEALVAAADVPAPGGRGPGRGRQPQAGHGRPAGAHGRLAGGLPRPRRARPRRSSTPS